MSKLWGSRFKSKKTDALADKFTFSISFDYRLAKYDCIGSIAHAKMLGKCGIIPKKDSAQIVSGLQKILKKIENGQWKFDPRAEDVHSNIQNDLKKLIGPAADKLHSARSRNDQIVLDVKLYCLDELKNMIAGVTHLQKSILQFASKNSDVIIPAYTHLQAAQVVLLAHQMLAYIEMLERDKARFYGAIKRTNLMPLGSCALSGSTLPTDRMFLSKELGFFAPNANSMDAVSDRDFIIEILSDIAIAGIHLSRIAEDLILWATKEFDYVDIDWSFCTGSSIMPHKKNPDVLELIRGTSAKLIAHVSEIMTLTKGLPSTYNRDLQLDKPALFDSVETIQDCLNLLAEIFAGLKVKKENVAKRINDESFFTVDVMEYLIQRGVSYRQAHDTVGEMVKVCLDRGEKISELSLSQLKRFNSKFENDVKKLLNPHTSIKMKRSFGSTNPILVKNQIEKWQKLLK